MTEENKEIRELNIIEGDGTEKKMELPEWCMKGVPMNINSEYGIYFGTDVNTILKDPPTEEELAIMLKSLMTKRILYKEKPLERTLRLLNENSKYGK